MASHRSLLLAGLRVLAAVPLASGTAAVLGGTRTLPGGGPTPATVDGEYRFANVFWGATGPLLWWSLARPEERAGVTRLVLALAGAGGFARLLSWRQEGRPHPVFLGALALEFAVVPTVLVAHDRWVVKATPVADDRGNGRRSE